MTAPQPAGISRHLRNGGDRGFAGLGNGFVAIIAADGADGTPTTVFHSEGTVSCVRKHLRDVQAKIKLAMKRRKRTELAALEAQEHRLLLLVRQGVTKGYANAIKSHCKRGHELAGLNVRVTKNGGRCCRVCERERASKRDRRRPKKTHCCHGHPFSEENTLIKDNGHRICRQCNRDRQNAWFKRTKTGQMLVVRPMDTEAHEGQKGVAMAASAHDAAVV